MNFLIIIDDLSDIKNLDQKNRKKFRFIYFYSRLIDFGISMAESPLYQDI